MNILHINEQQGWRGGEQQSSYLIRGLVRRGHNVVIAGKPESEFLTVDHGSPEIMRVPAPFIGEFDVWTAWTLARAVRRYRVDILHAHTSHAHSAACMAQMLARQGRVVVSRRVDFPPRTGWINRWKYSRPDMFVAVSNYIANVMRTYGIEEARLRVVHSATDPSRFDVPPLSRTELGVPENAPLLGNVAALVGHKDHANLLAAMPLVLRELPNLRLIIVGEGELRPAVERQIAELGIGPSVRLLGHRSDVPRILRTLDAFVLSSKEEGFGGACLEAMACGLPVVSTAAGGMPETVIHEKTGLLVPIRDPQALAAAIVRVFHESDFAERLGAQARQQVHERFTTDHMVMGNLAVYEEVLAHT